MMGFQYSVLRRKRYVDRFFVYVVCRNVTEVGFMDMQCVGNVTEVGFMDMQCVGNVTVIEFLHIVVNGGRNE